MNLNKNFKTRHFERGVERKYSKLFNKINKWVYLLFSFEKEDLMFTIFYLLTACFLEKRNEDFQQNVHKTPKPSGAEWKRWVKEWETGRWHLDILSVVPSVSILHMRFSK